MTRLRFLILAVFVGRLLFPANVAHAADLLEVVDQRGPADNRIDLVITGDGYTAAQADQFRADADTLLQGLFAQTPWGAYRGLFNVYLVVTESAESGADHPSQNIYRDTYFDAEFEYYGIDRLTYADESRILNVVTGLLPEVDQVVLLINDPTYGGAGGTVAMGSVHPDAVTIVVHELGHSFAGLADEYTDAYPGYPAGDYEPNVDYDSTFDAIKWNAWIEPGTPLPTLMSSATGDYLPVGAYEGARYVATGIYRPAPHCLMQQLAYELCDICNEAMTLAFYEQVDPVDSAAPGAAQVEVDRGNLAALPVAFSVDVVEVAAPGPLTVRWLLDARDLGTGADLAFDPNLLGVDNGIYTLTAEVVDETPWVRVDPSGLLTSERSWTVTVGGVGVDAGVAGDGGSPGPGSGKGCGCTAPGSGTLPGLLLVLFGLALWLSRRAGRTRRTAS